MSRSFRPWNFSGSGRSDLLRSVNSEAFTDISPVRVRNISPFTPIISPMSRSLNAA